MSDLDKFAVEILNGRYIATLATHNQDGHIHLTAVWYLYKDGKPFVATNSNSSLRDGDAATVVYAPYPLCYNIRQRNELPGVKVLWFRKKLKR